MSSALLPLLLAVTCCTIGAQAPPAFFANDRVVLVAHGGSPFSLALARRYAELRHVPAGHVLVLDDVPGSTGSAEPISLADCRDRILRPIQAWMQQHGIADEVDAIVYSSGFPHAVDIKDAPAAKQPQIGGLAALTGLTCFLREVVADDLSGLALDANRYARRLQPPDAAARGFGSDAEGRGRRYLSVMLAWLGPFGSSHAEAVAGLERSAAADASNPAGTFYFLQNDDVRARTRQPLFAVAMGALQQQGRNAALLHAGVDGQDGILPQGKHDVLGAVIGSAGFDWSKCKSSIVPGAIVEHLTSFGASFQIQGQTKLTALLRAGAAGACGTVTEPFAIQAKFPTPLIHAFYAAGCSLAEAFYQSVSGPYQLLIVGDACCRPFAALAPLQCEVATAWTGTVALWPVCASAAGFEAWLDGALVATAAAGEPLRIDSTQLADGPHELHVVAVGAPPIMVPTALAHRVTVANHGLAAILTAPGKVVELGRRIVLSGRVPSGAQWELVSGSTVLQAGSGAVRADLSSARLGLGSTEVRLRARLGDKTMVSAPVRVDTVAPVCPGGNAAPAGLLPGLAVDVGSGNKLQRRGVLAFADALPVAEGQSALVRGSLQVPVAGLHEWTLGGGGLQALSIDGRKVVEGRPDDPSPARGVVVDFAAGWHTFELQLRAGASPCRLSLLGPGGALQFTDATCGQGPSGMELLARDRMAAKVAAWTDGDRRVAAPAGAEAVEVDLVATAKVGAVLVSFVGAGLSAADLDTRIAVETRDGGGWVAVRDRDLRLLGPVGDRAALLALVGGKQGRQLRVRARSREWQLPAVSEVEVFVGSPLR